MITTVYLIRHASKMAIWKSSNDYLRPLSRNGEREAIKLCAYKRLKKVDYIYSSYYSRAIQSIKYLADKLMLPIHLSARFNDRIIGEQSLGFQEFMKKQWQDFDFSGTNGESLNDVAKRMLEGIDNIILNHLGKTIVISTHSTCIGALLNYYNNDFTLNEYQKLKAPDLIKLEFDNADIKSIEIIDYRTKTENTIDLSDLKRKLTAEIQKEG